MSVPQLALPFNQELGSQFELKKLIFTDESDNSRITCTFNSTLHDNTATTSSCSTITSSFNRHPELPPKLVSYVQNRYFTQNSTNETPLLISLSPDQNRIKLTVSINFKYLHHNIDRKALIISKSLGDDDSIDLLKFDLDNSKFSSETRELSKLPFTNFPLEDSGEELQRIVVNDSFKRSKFQGNRLCVFLWELDLNLGEHTPIFNFKVWIEEETFNSTPLISQESSSISLNNKPSKNTPINIHLNKLRDSFSIKLEDGPEFRKFIAFFEKHLPLYKASLESTFESMKQLEKLSEKLTSLKRKFLENFKNLLKFSIFEPILVELNFIKEFERILDSLFDPLQSKLNILSKHVLEPKIVSKVSSQLASMSTDDKNPLSWENQKKIFENNSKEYYNWLNKYLSNEKERPELKLFLKRKAFEVSKLDYLSFIYNCSNGQYNIQLIENLFKLLNVNSISRLWNISKIGNTWSSIQPNTKYQTYLKFVSEFNSERMLLRQRVEASKSMDELADLIKNNPLTMAIDDVSNNEEIPFVDSSIAIVFPSSYPSISAVSTSAEDLKIDQNSEMEGILYTLGGKGKPGWHKEWVSLSDGQLREFSDWRKGTTPINKPIEIALSSVRMITKDKRKNCFEVTSLDAKHVFQAVNEKERDNWIKALYNAGQHVDTERIKATTAVNSIKKKSNTLQPTLKLPTVKTKFLQVNSDSPSPLSITTNLPLSEKDYLKELRIKSEENKNNLCADCGSTESIEWVSLNFLTVFCVKCCGAHRSLGSDISRIKSLKLDNFKNEQEFLIKYVDNAKVNLYLEFNIGKLQHKLLPDSSNEQRLEYIRNKYLKKLYCEKIHQDELDNLLITSVQNIIISDALKYVTLGADINMSLTMNLGGQSIKMSLIEYSLRKYVLLEKEKNRKLFVISEILILNGAKVDAITRLREEIGVVEEAKQYWIDRTNRLH